jgi:predicted DNA-binding transcriptional regulator AlpA
MECQHMPKKHRIYDADSEVAWGAAEIAAYTHLPLRTVHYLTSQNRLPIFRLGPRLLGARKSELDRYLSSNKSDDK